MPRGDVHDKSREAWKWMVAVLLFWGDEASSADGIVYRGQDCSVSALAEYVLNTINPGLEPGSKVTWDDVVIRTPWMAKWLHSMTARSGKDGQVPSFTSTRRVLRVGNCSGKEILRAHLEFCLGEGKNSSSRIPPPPVPSPSPHPPD